MIIQNISDNDLTDVTFSCPTDQVDMAKESLEEGKKNNIIHYRNLDVDRQVSKISIVGIGMRSHSGIAKKCLKHWVTKT